MANVSKRKELETFPNDLEKNCQDNKKLKSENEISIENSIHSFKTFKILKVLSENTQAKSIFVQGKQFHT